MLPVAPEPRSSKSFHNIYTTRKEIINKSYIRKNDTKQNA